MKRRAPFLGLAATLALLLGCGGNVNLGGKGSDGGSNPKDETPTTTEPDPSASTSVVKFPEVRLDDLVVAGDYLYFFAYGGATQGLYRCNKESCKATLKLVAKGSFAFPQVLGDRLGVTRFNDAGAAGANVDLMTLALPDASDPQIVVGDLPAIQATPGLFTKDFVYFALLMDKMIYRCAQPNCAAGPEQIAPNRARNYVKLEADAGLLVWTDGTFIYRTGNDGLTPVETLLPDEQLSAAPADASSSETYPLDGVQSIAVQNGTIYAAVARSQDGRPCDSFCPHQIVGWPVNGGAIQVFLKSETRIRNVAIVDGELLWLGPSETPSNDAATMSTCRVEACEATQRKLGEIFADYGVFAADDKHVYWFEAKAQPPGSFSGFEVDEIRRAKRLPKP
jgi:hypothetical protein